MGVLIHDLEIDVATSEELTFENEVTEHPVESGSDVTDHVRARSIGLRIDGIVSDTPIGNIALQRIPGIKPSADARERLRTIRDKREPVDVDTPNGAFENMVLRSLQETSDASTGEAYRFSATFVQIHLVTNERTTVRVSKPNGKKKQDLGHNGSFDSEPPAGASSSTGALTGRR